MSRSHSSPRRLLTHRTLRGLCFCMAAFLCVWLGRTSVRADELTEREERDSIRLFYEMLALSRRYNINGMVSQSPGSSRPSAFIDASVLMEHDSRRPGVAFYFAHMSRWDVPARTLVEPSTSPPKQWSGPGEAGHVHFTVAQRRNDVQGFVSFPLRMWKCDLRVTLRGGMPGAKTNYDNAELRQVMEQHAWELARIADRIDAGRYPPPLVFLPGIAGSRLIDGNGEEYWPSIVPLVGDEDKLACDPQGRSLHALTAVDVLRGTRAGGVLDRIVASTDDANIYGPLLTHLATKGYVEGYNLLVFPYDWRLSNLSHLDELNRKIDEQLKLCESDQTALLCHSMGGLIARAYVLKHPDARRKIRTIISMGTPYGGAVNAFYAFAEGYDFENPLVSAGRMQPVAYNIASAYELLPDSGFIRHIGGELINPIPLQDCRELQFFSRKSASRLTWNCELFEGSHRIRDDVGRRDSSGNQIGTGGIPLHAIIGYGNRTLNGYIATTHDHYLRLYRKLADDAQELSFLARNQDGKLIAQIARFGDGDGTVPRERARLSDAALPGYQEYYVDREPYGSSKHADLPKHPQVWGLIDEILQLDGGEQMTVPLPRPGVVPPAEIVDDQVVFSLNSDAFLTITDDSGRRLGFDAEGRRRFDEIPGALCVTANHAEFAALPDLDREYTATVTGLREGDFCLDVTIWRDGRPTGSFTYVDVPVREGTVATLRFVPDRLNGKVPDLDVVDGESQQSVPAHVEIAPRTASLPWVLLAVIFLAIAFLGAIVITFRRFGIPLKRLVDPALWRRAWIASRGANSTGPPETSTEHLPAVQRLADVRLAAAGGVLIVSLVLNWWSLSVTFLPEKVSLPELLAADVICEESRDWRTRYGRLDAEEGASSVVVPGWKTGTGWLACVAGAAAVAIAIAARRGALPERFARWCVVLLWLLLVSVAVSASLWGLASPTASRPGVAEQGVTLGYWCAFATSLAACVWMLKRGRWA